ncbi:F-box only protein 8 [Capsicum chinense]|nr:F-box only protein 8 [Capsicum chinense]
MGTEILMDILKWLPLRSLLRFKCVSKFWNALISEPYFKMKQLSHAKNDKNSQRIVTSEIYPKGISPMYCCHLSSGSGPLNEDVQELDYPTGFIPWGCGLLCCCDP